MQMVVEDETVVATVHITPMRASRALALRYLATKFAADMENIVVRTKAPPLPFLSLLLLHAYPSHTWLRCVAAVFL